MCDKEPLYALGAGAFFYSVLSSDEIVFSSAGADCLERFGPSALHFPRGRQITNNEEEEMKKKMSRTLAVLMCLMTAVAFMPTFAFAEEGAASEQESVQQQEQSVDAQAEEPAAEEEAAAEQEPAPLAEEDTQVTEPAADAEVTFTVSNKGVLAAAKDGSIMVNKSVTVKDIDEDGVLSYDEALVALHKRYYASGAKGYSAPEGWVTKFWGDENGNYLFFKNNDSLKSSPAAEKVQAGDRLLASVNSDNNYYADWFAMFDKDSISVSEGAAFSLKLTGDEGMKSDFAPNNPVNGVKVGVWNDGQFQQIESKTTDTKGQVSLSFDKAGIYYVTAFGTVKEIGPSYFPDEYKLEIDCPIMAPVCIVTVEHGKYVHDKVAAGYLKNGYEFDKCEKCGDVKNYRKLSGWSKNYVKSFRVSKGKKSFTAKWKKQSKNNRKKFSGYQIRYAKNNKMTGAVYKNVSKSSKSKKIRKLSKKTTYYVQVRSYTYSKGVKYYAGWSKVKAVKTR